jgi:hypothetical protein
MATTDLILGGGLVTYQGSGLSLLDGTIVETFNRDDIMPDHKQYAALLGFVNHNLISPTQGIAGKSAPKGMDDVEENGTPKSSQQIFTPKKVPQTFEVANKYSTSYKFRKWAEIAQNLQGADGEMLSELANVGEFARDLALAYDIRLAETMVKVFSKGFSGGTLTPKGKNLFDTHTWGVTGSANSGTWANFTNGAITFDPANSTDITNGTTRLQTLINQLKTARDENGKYIKQEGPYNLFVSRANEVFWKAVLNNSSKFSGQGSNAMKENQFLFSGNIVEIKVIDLLGQPDHASTTIGTANYIFVTNSGTLAKSKALKYYSVYPLTIRTEQNKDTWGFDTVGRADIGADHFAAENYIVGSTCA